MYHTTVVHSGVGAMPETGVPLAAVSTSFVTATTTSTAIVTQTVKELLEIKIREMPAALATGTSTCGVVLRPTITDYVEGLVGNITTPLQTLATKTLSAPSEIAEWLPVAGWLVAGGLLGVGIAQLSSHVFRKRFFKEVRQRVPIPADWNGPSWKLKAMLALYRVQRNADELSAARAQIAALQADLSEEREERLGLEKKLKRNDGSSVTTPAAARLGDNSARRCKTPIAGKGKWDDIPRTTPLSIRFDPGEMSVDIWLQVFKENREKPLIPPEVDIQAQLLEQMQAWSDEPEPEPEPEPLSLADELTGSERRAVGDYDYDADTVMASIEEESEVSEGHRTTAETTSTTPPKRKLKLDLDRIPDLGPSKSHMGRGRGRQSSSPSPSPSRRTRSRRSPSKGGESSQVARRSSRVGPHVAGSMSERVLARRSSSPQKGE
ncbi:hypothetical protein K491DRAFT_675025 [Lophiostoma macrostomum CBS 122681]|uniref:Uncharacterized protein n=1 Tax=Lophiostoma macrostomum CBS 122681 TaxID=1314788 RepID=A0A6A6TMU6_9PLEO|nr:hypothetical protein K491DRAFT_675025 [Lophiostoma macrostomum CBS 122681]